MADRLADGNGVLQAELHWLRGALLAPRREAEAAEALHRALHTARKLSSRSLEIRAAASLRGRSG